MNSLSSPKSPSSTISSSFPTRSMSTSFSTTACFHSLFAAEGIRDRVVRIGSAGKSFSVTGWKVGYVTAEKLLQPIARAHQYITFTTPPALQVAVAAGLNLPDSYFTGLRAALAERRDLLVGGLRQAGFPDCRCTRHLFRRSRHQRSRSGRRRSCLQPSPDTGGRCDPGADLLVLRCPPTSKATSRFCFAKKAETLLDAVDRLRRWREGDSWRAAS